MIFDRIPPYLKTKYSLTSLIFIIWLTFFDQNNLIMQLQNKLDLYELEDERQYYLREIESARVDLNELTSDMKSLERFAREKYLMKRDNEEVFVFVER